MVPGASSRIRRSQGGSNSGWIRTASIARHSSVRASGSERRLPVSVGTETMQTLILGRDITGVSAFT